MQVIGTYRAQLAIAPGVGGPDYPKVSITLAKAGELGIAADRVQGGVGNHAVASLYMTDPRAYFNDCSGQIHAGDMRKRETWQGEPAVALHDV
jgi:hypothetical protein